MVSSAFELLAIAAATLFVDLSHLCRFWSSGTEAWPNIVHQEAAVSKVFGSRMLERYEPSLTLLEAIRRNDDVGAAPTQKALVSDEAAASQAEHFEQANQVCS
uniref:Uncharacterized protein n=1 Tax=Ananas comosus var. bracteatus TaxID=296719 RepID=A0A6V7PZK1_ANACO|nr:unnamed protein product [Ananas comosus var. bracteatus]